QQLGEVLHPGKPGCRGNHGDIGAAANDLSGQQQVDDMALADKVDQHDAGHPIRHASTGENGVDRRHNLADCGLDTVLAAQVNLDHLAGGLGNIRYIHNNHLDTESHGNLGGSSAHACCATLHHYQFT